MENKKTETKTLNQLKKEIRQMDAPTVWRTKRSDGTVFLVIVYKDREETYELKRSDSFKSIEKEYESEDYKYTRYDSEEMCRNSGGRQIHYQIKED